MAIAVVGCGVHLPGKTLGDFAGHLVSEPACPADRAHELLGRKGLLGKDPATRLALCAVHTALGLQRGTRPRDKTPDPRVGVVVSSNFGSVAAVRRIVDALSSGGLRSVSALDAPNASSNVLASVTAIWFRCGGPNLLVCSGATSGLDAAALAGLLLRAGRADRVVLVGAEPDDDVAQSLNAGRRHRPRPLVAGAAAVVLERAGESNAPGVFLDVAPRAAEPPGAASDASIDRLSDVGDMYGALGVLQIAVAAELVRARPGDVPHRIGFRCGDASDGWRAGAVGNRPAMPWLRGERSAS